MDRCAWKVGALFVAGGMVGCAGSPGGDAITDPTGGAGSSTLAGAGIQMSTTAEQGGSTGTGGSLGPGGAGGSSVAFVDASKPFASRVVAYLPTYRGLDAWASQLDYSKITHVDLAFANPTSGNDPTLGPGSDGAVARIVDGAHAKGVRVLISIGGASGGSERIAALLAPGSVQGFVQKLDAFLDPHNLDGPDAHLQGDPVPPHYGPFVEP